MPTTEKDWDYYNELWGKWADRNGLARCKAIASMEKSPRERAYTGKCVLVAFKDEFFGGEQSKDYRSRVLNNPSWATVFKCFEESLQATNDLHHCFLEGLHKLQIDQDGENYTVLRFSTGS